MSLTIEKTRVPLQMDQDGVLRVGGTRVTIDTVIAAFKDGATAEEIVYRYPTLKLADVYAVLSYYLGHHQDIEDYLKQRQLIANQIRRENQERFGLNDIRQRLLSRQAKTG